MSSIWLRAIGIGAARIDPECDGCDMRGRGIRTDRRGREIGAAWSEDVVE